MQEKPFVDYYEALQLSPNASSDTVERVYRLLAKRYHPDNLESGDSEKFSQLYDAYRVLSDPEARAAYDVRYESSKGLQWKIFDQQSVADSFESDRRIFQGILSLLYTKRRQDVDNPGLGTLQLERLLGCPEEHLNFHIWYLKQKGWLERLQNGLLAITVDGVEQVVQGEMMLRRDRLLAEKSSSPEGQTRREGKFIEETDSTESPNF